MNARAAALCLALCLSPACKKKDSSPDAGPSGIVALDPATNLELTLPVAWRGGSALDGGTGPIVLDVRRAAEPGSPVLVAPRLVVGIVAADQRDLSTVIDDELMELRHMEDRGTAKIDRVTKGRRSIAGQEAVELRVDFRVSHAGAPADITLTQREWVFYALDKDQKKKLVTVNISSSKEDDERLGREVEDVLRSLHQNP